MPHTWCDVSEPQAAAAPNGLPDTEPDLVVPEPPRCAVEMPEAPACAGAVGVASYLMRAAKVNSWAELDAAIQAEDPEVATRLAAYNLDDQQLTLLDDWVDVIGLVVIDPPRTVGVCDGCGQWMLLGRKPAPSGCRLTSGCTGRVVKAPRGKKIAYEPDDPADQPAETVEAVSADTEPEEETLLATVIPLPRHGSSETVSPGEAGGMAESEDVRTVEVEVEESFGDVDQEDRVQRSRPRDLDDPAADPRYDTDQQVEPADFDL